MDTSRFEKQDIPFNQLLYKRLRSGLQTYRTNLIAVSIIRITVVVVIWSILLLRISSVTPIVAVIVSLICYAFVEVYSIAYRIKAARLEMEITGRRLDDEL